MGWGDSGSWNLEMIVWRGPYYISGDLDSHPDVPYKEGAGGTNAATSRPTLLSISYGTP